MGGGAPPSLPSCPPAPGAPDLPAPPAATPRDFLNKPVWRKRFHAAQHALDAANPGLLWLGDSITQRWEQQGEARPNRRYTDIWNHYYAPRRALNMGASGDATCHLLWRVQNWDFSRAAPRAAVLLIGTNNFHPENNWDAADTAQGIAAIITTLQLKLPAMPILLLGIPPSDRGDWATTQTSLLNHALSEQYGQPGTSVIFQDITAAFLRDGALDRGAFTDPTEQPPRPAVHPTAPAMARVAALIEPALSVLLGDAPKEESASF